ncbi:MAG: PAS domain S-box protein, partial [Candidatus Omnitrophica bacterium]|nr:PAS domain S-box protein [Candidatus Omnitrophota bacterium]
MTEKDKTKEELIEEATLLRKRIAELEELSGEGAQTHAQARVSKIHQSYLTKYANDLIILLDDDFRFLETNERVVDSYGYTREELLGMHATQLRAPETKVLFEEQIKPGRMTGKAVYGTLHQRKDGTKFPVEISLRAIDVDGKRFYQAIIRDITERKKAEERLNRALEEEVKSREILTRMLADNNQIRERLERNIEELKHTQAMLIQSEKLASLGRLVSEIAHEVNNPLMIISGNAQLSLMSESASVEVKNSQRIITEECQRAKSIIERLLRFS